MSSSATICSLFSAEEALVGHMPHVRHDLFSKTAISIALCHLLLLLILHVLYFETF